MKKPTLIDFAILGLIQNQPMSGYAIRKVFEETALGSYSSSPGTIYPALKRMQKLDLVTKTASNKSVKSQFQITKIGLHTLKKWLLQPIEKSEVEKKREEILLRFAFMDDLLSKTERINFLITFQDLLKAYLKELDEYHSNNAEDLPLHGRLAFEHGIASYKTTLKWCNKAIQELKNHI